MEIKIAVDPVKVATCTQCGAQVDVAGQEPFTAFQCPACGNAGTVPARLGQFTLFKLINIGGMGAVFSARDETLGRLVAIKVMLKSLGEDVDFIERFRHEARAAARLNHPNVAQIHSFGQEKGQPYIVMELVSGQRLDRLIEGSQGLDAAFVLQVGIEIAEGLNAADEIGLVHGDVKPENILLDEKGHAKLVDFGIASFARDARADAEGIWGTPYYIAPERVQHQKLDARADIYSLGATLYHALCGRPPFEGRTPAEVIRARLGRNPPPLRARHPGIDRHVERIIARMLQAEAARRYPTYASLLGDMRQVQSTLPPPAPGSAAAAPGGKQRKVMLKKKVSLSDTTEPLTEGKKGGAPATGKFAINTGGTAKLTSLTDHAERAREAEGARKQAHRKRTRVTLLVLTAAAALGFGGLQLHRHREDKQARTSEMRRREMARQEAIALLGQIQRVVNGLANAAAAQPLVARATNAAVAVLGELPKPVVPPAAVPKPKAGARGRAPAGEAGVTNATAIPPSEAVRTPAPADDDSAEKRRMSDLALQVLSDWQRLDQRVAEARQIESAAAKLQADLMQASNTEMALAGATNLAQRLTAAQQIRDEVGAALPKLERAAREAETIRAAVRRKQQQRQAGEVRLRKEEERREQIAEELRRAAQLDEDTAALARQFRFEAAIKLATNEAARYRTEEGRNAAQTTARRCSQAAEFLLFLVERLNADPFAWGWEREKGLPEDVLGADASGVKLRGRMVPWAKVSPSQMRKFVEHYTSSAKLSPGNLAKQYLNAAVFFHESGNPGAARAYAEKAVETSPHIREDVKGLLPPD